MFVVLFMPSALRACSSSRHLWDFPNYHNSKEISQQTFTYSKWTIKKNTRKRFEICPKLTIKTPERRQRRCFSVFVVNFEYITPFSGASTVDFEQVKFDWAFRCDKSCITDAGFVCFQESH